MTLSECFSDEYEKLDGVITKASHHEVINRIKTMEVTSVPNPMFISPTKRNKFVKQTKRSCFEYLIIEREGSALLALRCTVCIAPLPLYPGG